MASPFLFKMRAYAAAHLDLEQHIEITWPDAKAYLQSEYTGGSSGRAYAVTLYAEILGEAACLEDAQLRLSALIGNALPIVALAANAAIDNPRAVGVFGLNLIEPQEFMWYAGPQASDFFPPGLRKIHPDATLDLMTAIGHHAQTDLLQRAAECYRNALSNWFPEHLLMAGEFLFIAAETLSRCLVETRASERGITPKNLARLVGASGPKNLRNKYLRDEIFAGDDQALQAMKDASNGFEHGYMAVQDVRGLIEPILERSMTLVRRALVLAADARPGAERILLGGDYSEPRALVPPLHIVRGELARKDETKPPPSDLHTLEFDLPRPQMIVREMPGGRVDFDFNANLKGLHLPDNVEARNVRPGLRAAHVKPPPADSNETVEP
jgi:hypothetical protein